MVYNLASLCESDKVTVENYNDGFNTFKWWIGTFAKLVAVKKKYRDNLQGICHQFLLIILCISTIQLHNYQHYITALSVGPT